MLNLKGVNADNLGMEEINLLSPQPPDCEQAGVLCSEVSGSHCIICDLLEQMNMFSSTTKWSSYSWKRVSPYFQVNSQTRFFWQCLQLCVVFHQKKRKKKQEKNPTNLVFICVF